MSDIIAISPNTQEHFVSLTGLRAYFETLTDTRKGKGKRYRLPDVLTLLVLAKLAGEDKMKGIAEWVRLREAALLKLLNMPRKRLPHQTTYERILAGLDEEAFNEGESGFEEALLDAIAKDESLLDPSEMFKANAGHASAQAPRKIPTAVA